MSCVTGDSFTAELMISIWRPEMATPLTYSLATHNKCSQAQWRRFGHGRQNFTVLPFQFMHIHVKFFLSLDLYSTRTVDLPLLHYTTRCTDLIIFYAKHFFVGLVKNAAGQEPGAFLDLGFLCWYGYVPKIWREDVRTETWRTRALCQSLCVDHEPHRKLTNSKKSCTFRFGEDDSSLNFVGGRKSVGA